MSQFYAKVSGTGKNLTTKTGTKKTGMSTTTQGYGLGCYVDLSHRESKGEDFLQIYLTLGENGKNENKKLLIFEGNEKAVNEFMDNGEVFGMFREAFGENKISKVAQEKKEESQNDML